MDDAGVARPAGGLGRALELLAFAVTVPLAGRLLFPTDPLGLDAGFPWVALGPAAVAARYGVGAGLITALLAIATFAWPSAAHAGRADELATLAGGTLLLALVVGDLAGGWRRRGLRAEAGNEYLRHRLEEFSTDYHVLKVSHGQLEEFVAGQRTSLRGALLALRPALAAGGENEGGLADGRALMAVFARFCSVQVAGLYAMRNDTLVDPAALAVHGEMGDLPLFDPLLRRALAERRVVSVKLESAAAEQHGSALLAVVPIVDSRNRLHGVLAIRDMHFMAFQQRNLNLLALLAGYVGDLIARGGGLDDAPAERFVAELDTALRFAPLARGAFVAGAPAPRALRASRRDHGVRRGRHPRARRRLGRARAGRRQRVRHRRRAAAAGRRARCGRLARAHRPRGARALRRRSRRAAAVSSEVLTLDARHERRDAAAFIAADEGASAVRAGSGPEANEGSARDVV